MDWAHHVADGANKKKVYRVTFIATFRRNQFIERAVVLVLSDGCWVDFSRVSLVACREYYCHVSYWQHSFLQQRSLSQQSIHHSCSGPAHGDCNSAHQCPAHHIHICIYVTSRNTALQLQNTAVSKRENNIYVQASLYYILSIFFYFIQKQRFHALRNIPVIPSYR